MSEQGQGTHRVQLRKTDFAIEYSHDGEQWHPLYTGEPEAVATTWTMVQLGYCNDDLVRVAQQEAIQNQEHTNNTNNTKNTNNTN